MIKILEEGHIQIVRCSECKCLFSFDNDDIQNESVIPVIPFITPIPYEKQYIKCPCCGYEIVLKQPK